MRLCVWAGASSLLPVLLVLLPNVLLNVRASEQHPPRERHYYIAAVEIDWDYSGNGSGPTYKKVVFREYEKGFTQAKTHPSWLGLLGPTLRAEEGETIVVTFRNMATGHHSIHPHGVAYGKQSEGANYFDNTSLKEKEDDVVRPDGEHVYTWEVTPEVSPQRNDPSCLTYTYISHKNVVEDYNSGLIGALLICKPGSLDEMGQQVDFHHEYVFLFGVFDEKESMYKPNSYTSDNHVKYTINGFTWGSLPDVSLCAYASVSLHLMGMSSEAEAFSVHMNGQVLQENGHKVSSVGLISGSSTTVSMVALHTGRWLLSSHTVKHMEVGLHGFVDVKICDGFTAPRRRMTIQQRRNSRVWEYFIAAEEIIWDYAPHMPEHIDKDFKDQYLTQSPTRIGGKYKKAVYTQYTDNSFTQRQETKQRKNELGILGPVIRAQIRDVIKITFKNMASRPYSIYPHGLTIEKSEEGVNYPPGGNHSHSVPTGETHTYVWKVVEEDEPLEEDPRCLTRLYHSAVDTVRDIASGLIGPILICKSQSLNVRNAQLKADKEQHAMFAVFDENKSWYLHDNIRQYCDRSKVHQTDGDFKKSNIMHTINGYSFESGPVLGFCNGEVATWHVSSIGAQDYIQTATFYGHPFDLNNRKEDLLSLYPMTGETISITMDNIGVWLLASLNSHETTKGVRVKFQDVECFRDYEYEYTDTETEHTVWKLPALQEIEEKEEEDEEEKVKPQDGNPVEIDIYTEMFADELGLRSLKNQSGVSDVEQLDLSFLDYDAIDVLDGNTNSTLVLANTTRTLNETNWNETDGVTMTETDNTTVFDSPNLLVNNNSVTTNATASNTKNTTILNATAIPIVGNVSTEINNLTDTLQSNSSSILKTKNATQTGDNQTLVDTMLMKTEEELTRGDVFFYPGPQSNASTKTLQEGNETSYSPTKKDGSNTTSRPGNTSTDGKTESVPLPVAGEDDFHIADRQNSTTIESVFESRVNKTSDNDSLITTAEPKHGLQVNSSAGNLTTFELVVNSTDSDSNNDSLITTAEPEHKLEMNSSEILTVPANSSLQNATHVLPQNVTVNMSLSNSSVEVSSESRENVTALFALWNQTSSEESLSNETMTSGNVSMTSSEELSASESSEELFIYLKENDTSLIKTTSVKTHGHNWTYDGSHQIVPKEFPDYMMKYFKPTPPRKKTKKVNRRQRPQRGQGMKTRKRKIYKPQARSGLPSFSPRGFNPAMTPRGSRPVGPQPVSDEEHLINMPVVIGVPRPDFSDYELYVPNDEPDHLSIDEHDVKADEYEYVMYKDPYSGHEDIKNLNLDETTKYYLKYSGPNVKTYFIAAEEVQWDYAGYGQRRQDKSEQNSRETKFTKVVFRSYMDSSFTMAEIRGEVDEHLGILGPLIKAEVGQSIMVVFKNNASRPYSLHPNGVTYTKQTEGLSYEDNSTYWYKYDNEVQPTKTFTYIWKVDHAVGPTSEESNCRTWAYYSGVNPEKDIHSGLIGPLLVCREGTLSKEVTDMRDFTLLFMTFDESQSWYYEKNQETMWRKSRRRVMNSNIKENFKFHTINGIIYNLKGLRMYTNQLVNWHLINMGSSKDFHSIHFHGQTFLHKKTTSYRQAVFPLLPGSFATLEMYPSKPGLWQLESEIGFNQQRGMQTLFLVLDNDCYRPLGLELGSVKDDQITALNTRGYWQPSLARLNNQGKYNAWSTDTIGSWIQVDFQRPVVISQVATQGARQMFSSHYVLKYYISYSTDRRKWIFYKGDSRDVRKAFDGNNGAHDVKKNTFFPPLIGRFIRLHPITWEGKATVRMEFYGCELDGCSVPLGMESGLIEDSRITASSTASSWYSGPWRASLARLNKQGTINAWQAKYNDMGQWLQVELPHVKKITGIITQGAKALGTEMYVISYSLLYSHNGLHWIQYTDDEAIPSKTFLGNTDNNDHVKNYIYPPIFSRFIRIVPRSWKSSITLRIELLGCDFE